MKFERKEITDTGIVQITTEDERWYFKEGIYVPSVSWITGYYPKGKQYERWLREKGDEADDIRDLAAERGSKVHQAIDRLLKVGEVKHDDLLLNNRNGQYEEMNAEEYGAFLSFVQWMKDAQPEVLFSEFTVFNEADGYAGTVDMIVKIKGKIGIIDVKTSKSVYPSHRLQVSAYKHAFKTAPIDFLGILQVGTRSKAGYKFTDVEDEYELFLAVKKIWASECANIKPFQMQYPLTTKLEDIWVLKKDEPDTTSESPAANSSAKSTAKKGKKSRTPDTSEKSGFTSTSTKKKKSRSTKSRLPKQTELKL